MTTNIPEVLAQASRAFADMNRLLKDTQENLGRFSVDLKKLTSSGRGLGRLVSSMEKLGSANWIDRPGTARRSSSAAPRTTAA